MGIGQRLRDELDVPREYQHRLVLAPGLTEEEFAEFEGRLPAPVPAEIRTLLRQTSGFELSYETVSFVDYGWAYEFLAPHVMLLTGADGDHWVLEIDATTGAWEHVWFQCHDPPVMLYVCRTLDEVVDAWFDPSSTLLDGALDACLALWKTPVLRPIPVEEARKSTDAVIRRFAESIDDGFGVLDLRNPRAGDGFDWSGFDGDNLVRHETVRLYGLPPVRRGLVDSVLGWLGG